MEVTALIVTDPGDNSDMYHLFETNLRTHGIMSHGCSFHAVEFGRKLGESGAQILVLDGDYDEKAMEVLKLAREMDPSVAVFVCMDTRTATLEREFLSNGTMYVFSKQMGATTVVDCIVRIYNMHTAERRHELVYPELVRILRKCCINARQRGYHAIYDCVHLLYRMQGAGMPLTKKVYPSIAKKNNTTSTRLEKNIRDAIKNAWEAGGQVTIPEYLGCSPDRPPTNGQLIMCICEKLRENMAELEAGREPAHA